ncbi:MAG: glycine--tRNA ligase subunit beta [Polyangiaceae bacterium]
MALPARNVLLEIGTEELPSSFVDAALAALPEIVAAELARARLTHGAVRPLGTPRRLAFVAHDVAARQLDLDEQVVGPPETAAFKDGKPTRAAEAFAQKLGIAVDALTIVDKPAGPKQKPGRYVTGRMTETGKPAEELLGGVLARVCAAIPFKKSMRWADLDTTFGRPVQWLVALFGGETVAFEFAGVRAGRASRGHRFLAPARFDVASPDAYVGELRTRHVLADRDERRRTMMENVAAAAKAAGGSYDDEALLVDENASLVEEPHVVTGAFDPAFLELPAAVIRAVARGHQRYFCVQRSADELLPSYLAVVNTANRPDLITKGSDRVMRARLSDARFFWSEDLKTPLAQRLDKLGGIVFHHRLGSVREKVERMSRLVVGLAATIGLDTHKRAHADRAALLCKCDLVTLMVGEFPELQGHMGRSYALRQGEPAEVADAVRDHYRPVGAQDVVAPDDVSAVVALADRLDTLAGCFAVGLAPTGAADPFALRRACIAVLRTLVDRGYASIDFSEWIGKAYDGLSSKKLDLSRADAVTRVDEFATERLRGLLASATSTPVADAVISGAGGAGHVPNAVAAMARARALQAVVDAKEPWLDKAKVVAKRLGGISREAQPVLHHAGAFDKSSKADDAAIDRLVRQLDDATKRLTTEQAMRDALMSMGRIATELDRIVVETLVNDPADSRTKNRLETLAHGARSMLAIADFSKLA